MIGFTPPRWQALKDKWAFMPWSETSWAQYAHTDGDGFVRMRTLLLGNVTTWASEIMEQDLRRDHTYREDYTQRLRDGS